MLGDEARGQRRGEFAYHALAGVPIVAASRAVHYAREAGEHALDQLAPQEATRWFEHALALHESASSELEDGDGDALLCDLLIGHGIAEQQSGEPEFRATLLEASERAARMQDTGRLVRAVLANTRGFASETGIVDTDRVAMLEAALDAIGDHDSAERARLLATLSSELTYSATGGGARRSATTAWRSPRAWATPTRSRRCSAPASSRSGRPRRSASGSIDTDRELAIAQELGDPLAVFAGLHWKAAAAVEAGNLDLAADLVSRELSLRRAYASPPRAGWPRTTAPPRH